jgi:exosortase/archaeosortase family protein
LLLKNKKILSEKLEPFKGIIYFVVILFAANYFWKFTVKGDESDVLVTFFGANISAPFDFMVNHFASTISSMLHFFGSDVMQRNNLLIFENGNGIRIIWGCSGIKQAYIFFCIIAFTRGPWKKKLWYIPAGLLVVYLFNLFRMTVIVATAKNYFHWFDFLHGFLFKSAFYGVIFLMWLLWDEKIRKKKS